MRANCLCMVAMFMVLCCSAAMAVDLAAIPEACALVSKDEVQKIMGEELGKPEPDITSATEHLKLSGCTFSSTDGDKTITLMLRTANPPDNDPAVMIKAIKESNPAVEDVAGVGDRACWQPPSDLTAFKGKDTQVSVNVVNFAEPKDKAAALAKLAFEKLASAGKAEAEK